MIDSPELGAAYPRLAECPVDAMAFVPSVADADVRLLGEYGAALVGCSGSELADPGFQRDALKVAKAIKAIALTGGGADPAIAARLGFRGFLSRDVPPGALERTLRAVVEGEIAFPRSTLTELFQLLKLLPRDLSDEISGPLTPRQLQIVDLIAEGATDREIAARLRISQSTAHKHVQNALRRSKARTRSQLVAVARQPAFG